MAGELTVPCPRSSSPSPDPSASRKRPLEEDPQNDNPKKSNSSSGLDGKLHLKVLVPCVAAGAIIGKGGETIAQLQKKTGVRIKMSKANDFYPGTTERVCLISGSKFAIMEALEFINFKVREKPESTTPKSPENEVFKANDRDKQVKILVPNSTAGMIIGKGGNFIKRLKDESGAYVQISQKAKEQTLQERCITVIGDPESNRKACKLILSKIEEDPHSGSCLNVSYADVSGPVANFSPTGSPYAQSTSSSPVPWPAVSESGLAGLTLTLNLEPSNVPPQTVVNQVVNNMTVALNSSAYPEHIKTEVISAIATLAKYRMLGISSLPNVGLPRLDASNGFFGHIAPSISRIELAFEQFRSSAPTGVASPSFLNNNAFILPAPESIDKTKETRKVEMEIPERLVGAVLGEGGRSLTGLQEATGALIQISKKGIFVPGTRNRLATISGDPSSILIAHSLIQQRIAEEQIKRSRQEI